MLIKSKEVEDMVDVYALLVMKGLKKIDSVPKTLRAKVEQRLKDLEVEFVISE